MGKLILFEGIDCAGKSTQALKLSKKLNIPLLHFPYEYVKSYELINKTDNILNNHYLMVINRLECQDIIKKNLTKGHLIIDRYIYSGIAYGMARGLDKNFCISLERSMIKPDIIIYINMDPLIASKRKGYGELNEEIDFQYKVSAAYNEIIDQLNNNVLVIDGEQSEDNIYECIGEFLFG